MAPVLSFLKSFSFEPLQETFDRYVFFKTKFLLSLTSIKRGSECRSLSFWNKFHSLSCNITHFEGWSPCHFSFVPGVFNRVFVVVKGCCTAQVDTIPHTGTGTKVLSLAVRCRLDNALCPQSVIQADPGNGPCQQEVLASYINNNNPVWQFY